MLRAFAFGLIIILSLIGSICTQYVGSESGIAATVTSFLWTSAQYHASPIDVGQGKVSSRFTMYEMGGGGIETRQKPPEPASGFLRSKLRDRHENAGTNRIAASQGTAVQTTVTLRMAETLAIRYVSNGGNDTNDGLSWATAKHTIYGALVSLPGGGRNTAGSGTIYVGTGSSANPTSGAGIWLMGPTDPNYASPPAGWLKCGGCSVDFIGVANTAGNPNGHSPLAKVYGGSATDRNHPSLWLSGGYSYRFQNLSFFSFAGRGIVIGECSNNTRGNTCGVSGVTFNNTDAEITQTGVLGPCTDITGNSYWIFFHDFGCTGNTGGTNGYTANNAASILVDGTGNNGNGLIYIYDSNFDNGGIKFIPGASGGGMSVKNVIEESGGPNCAPVVWYTAWNAQTYLTTDNVVQADCPNNVPSVQNDATNTAYGAPVAINTGVTGPSVVLNPFPGSTTISPLRQQQYGINRNYLVGETDVARRIAGLIPTRFANKAYPSTASWTFTNAAGTRTFTQNLTDPFGGTGAASITSTSATNEQLYMAAPLNVTPAAGDWLVEGVWVKGAWAPTASVYLIGNCAGYGYPTTSATYYNSGLQLGDGQWQYVWFANKFAGGTGNTSVCMTGQFNNGAGPTLYGPTMYYIPAGTLSDNEVLEFASTMNSVDPRCQVGQICNVSGHPVVVSSYGTLSNCSSVASPAKCDSAPAGSFVLGVGSTSATVNTTAVTANSQILIIEDSSLGAKLGVSCNTATGRTYMITDRAPGLSFTVSSSLAPTDHPACLSFQLLN